MTERRIPAGNQCAKCTGRLDGTDIAAHRTMHPLCEWATPQDWAALRSWFSGTLTGVDVSGG